MSLGSTPPGEGGQRHRGTGAATPGGVPAKEVGGCFTVRTTYLVGAEGRVLANAPGHLIPYLSKLTLQAPDWLALIIIVMRLSFQCVFS